MARSPSRRSHPASLPRQSWIASPQGKRFAFPLGSYILRDTGTDHWSVPDYSPDYTMSALTAVFPCGQK